MKNGGGGLGIVYVSEKELCEDLRVIVIENLIEGGAYAFNFHLPGVSENMFPWLRERVIKSIERSTYYSNAPAFQKLSQ